MKHYTIVGNWKLHFGPEQAAAYVKKLKGKIIDHKAVTVVVAPPFVDLVAVNKKPLLGHLKLGAQNISEFDEGAHTGEVSGPMLAGLAQYVIVGHSERRREMHESDKQIAQKLAAARRSGITSILCVGENLIDRQHGNSKHVVVDQLTAALAQFTAADVDGMLVAYEPVWAIGTGEYAKPDQVLPIVAAIRHTIEELYGEAAGAGIEVLYGGSVDAENAGAYLKLRGVNGLLVGGASLNAESFNGIVRAAQHIAIS